LHFTIPVINSSENVNNNDKYINELKKLKGKNWSLFPSVYGTNFLRRSDLMKRLLDIIGALFCLLILCPFLLLIAIGIKIDSNGPIIYKQRRITCNDQEFIMYKFRTMAVGTPELATEDMGDGRLYITRIGYYLRKLSLDEVPQLVNILLGQMSFVGPRPAIHLEYELRRLRNAAGMQQVKPGLTGWAQINGRDDIPLLKKFELDKYYMENQSLWLDLKIMCRTIKYVVAGSGNKLA
jgi:O-antigen biosynthesis protein WbqP